MEQNKDINQGTNNVPENPYTQSYQKYIVKPVTKPAASTEKAIGPKQIVSLILCGVSSVWIFLFSLTMLLLIISGNAGNSEDITFTLFFFTLISLSPAIVAKVLNRKSIWALINIICLSILFVAEIVIYLLVK